MSSDLSNDEVNYIITRLALPDPNIHVAVDYSNQRSNGEVQAYAKLAGSNWTYYVRSLTVVIGRQASDSATDAEEVQIDLGPSKVVSRKHAVIQYNGNFWEITVHGRNGVKIDKVSHKQGTARLFSGNILDIGGVQMMFVLPDSKPHIAQTFKKSLARLAKPESPHHTYIQSPSLGSFANHSQISSSYHDSFQTPQSARIATINQAQFANPAHVHTQSPIKYSSKPGNDSSDLYASQSIYSDQHQTSIENSSDIYQYHHHSSSYSTEYQNTSSQMIQIQPPEQSLQEKPKTKKSKQTKQSKKATKFIVSTDGGKGTIEKISSSPTKSSPYIAGKAIFSEAQGLGTSSQFIDQDLSGEGAKDIKPPFSYATMISQAILSTEEHMMSLADIYEWISTKYAYYRYSRSGWQNSIRHNLSLSKAFEKVPRKRDEPGKGMKWQIVQSHKEEFCRKAVQGDIIKGKSSNANRAFKRNAAARAAQEAAANKSISDIVKGLQEKNASNSQESGMPLLTSTDSNTLLTNDKYSIAKDENVNLVNATKDNTLNLSTNTLRDSQISTNSTSDASLSIRRDSSKEAAAKNFKPSALDNNLSISAEKMSATTPRKLGTGPGPQSSQYSSKTLPTSYHITQSGNFSSPASALGNFADQYPFTSISDIAAGTALATLSTPSPTHRYSNAMISAIEGSGGMINGMFSHNPSDSFFSFGINATDGNGLTVNSMGTMSTVTPMSAIGVSQLEAYTPDRGGSAHDSPNSSFKSGSRSKSAITPNTAFFFDKPSASKSGNTSISSILPNSMSKVSDTRDSPLKRLPAVDNTDAGDPLKTQSTLQDSQTQDKNLSPSLSSSSTRVSSDNSRSNSDEAKGTKRKFFESNNEEVDSPDINLGNKKVAVFKESNSYSKTIEGSDDQEKQLAFKSFQSAEDSSLPLSAILSMDAASENKKPNQRQESDNSSSAFADQETAGKTVGLRRRSDTVDSSSRTHLVNSPTTATNNSTNSNHSSTKSDDENAIIKDSRIHGEPRTELNSPELNPLSFGAATIMSSVVASASRTPAPVAAKFQLTAPSSAQQKQLPSSFLFSASPASYWNSGNQYQFSATQTPLRAGGTPTAFSLAASGGSNSVLRGTNSTSGITRIGLLKSATNETVRRKKVGEGDYEHDIEMDEEDSDNMGFFSPSKNGTESTPTIKKMKSIRRDRGSGRLSKLTKPDLNATTMSELDEHVSNTENNKKNINMSMGKIHTFEDYPTVDGSKFSTPFPQSKAATDRRLSDVTRSDPETSQEEDAETTFSRDTDRRSYQDSSIGNSNKKTSKKDNGLGNESIGSAGSSHSTIEGNSSVTSNNTVNMSSSDQSMNNVLSQNSNNNHIADESEPGSLNENESCKGFNKNNETVEAIEGLQSLHDLNTESNDNETMNKGLGNLSNVDLTKSFHKVGKLAAAAATGLPYSVSGSTEPENLKKKSNDQTPNTFTESSLPPTDSAQSSTTNQKTKGSGDNKATGTHSNYCPHVDSTGSPQKRKVSGQRISLLKNISRKTRSSKSPSIVFEIDANTEVSPSSDANDNC